MEYNGYTAAIEYDPDDRVLHGRVNGISDVITFEGASVDELEAAFRSTVDEYIGFCEERGRSPQRPSESLPLKPDL
jgi:predicted HicB family RNase H-like nuclease